MKYFSMFSGIGGFELGIKEKGECIGFSEIDKYAIQTYQRHFPNHKNYGNATDINANELPDFDMLCGGFPCQAFSIAGKRLGFQDTRGTLFFEIARIVKAKKPKILFLENVKGLLNHDKGRTFTTILATIDELGYNAEWQVLNSKHFGVPQNRERVFIIGHLRGTSSRQVFPLRQSSQEDNSRTMIELTKNKSDAQRIYDSRGIAKTLKGEGGGQGAKTGLYAVRTHCLQQRSINRPSMKKNPNAGGHGHLSKDDGTAYCLDSGNTQAVEYSKKIRRLTPTECERLQGFPDGWTEGVSDTQRYRQLGNAVTVNVIEAIVKNII